MPTQSPIHDALSKPFFNACNEDGVIVQECVACTERAGLIVLQHSPAESCVRCG